MPVMIPQTKSDKMSYKDAGGDSFTVKIIVKYFRLILLQLFTCSSYDDELLYF